jgi:DNA polymerase
MEVSLDFETRSACDLRKAGAYKYAQDPSTDVWCAAFGVAGAAPILWAPGCDGLITAELLERVRDSCVTFRAFNAPFERAIWREIMHRRHGFPDIPLERWVCTAAEARAMNLPGNLDDCARVLGVVEQKDMAGHRLMLRMAKPRATLPDGTHIWWDDEERLHRLYEYCRQDVRTEQAIAARLQRLSDYEINVWRMDQRANDRGVLVDVRLAAAAKGLAQRVAAQANSDVGRVTGGGVDKITNVGRLKAWMGALDVPVDSLNKKALDELLNREDLPLPVREALEIRVEAGKSSVKKIEAMLNAAGRDGALRGLLLYWGAGTGRWAGRLVQPQNFPARTRAFPDWWVDALYENPEPLIGRVLAGDLDALEMEGPALEVLALLLRPMLRARPGRVLVAADYSAIEARVIAWLCDEEWRLEVFRTHGKIYEASASMMFNVPLDRIKKGQPEYALRQKGKVAELALGFQGGVNALITMGAYDMGLGDEELPEIVRLWREASPNIKAGWYALQEAAIEAVRFPGKVTEALSARVRFKVAGGFLWMKLPSGRRLAYCQPKLVHKPAPWDPEKLLPGIEAWSVDSKTKKWAKRSLYGGLLLENATQATARDLMADAMLRLDSGGKYLPLLSVHDEVVCECDEATADAAELERIMCETPDWAAGCPVAAEGFAAKRYRK